jgi:hypothetical protein
VVAPPAAFSLGGCSAEHLFLFLDILFYFVIVSPMKEAAVNLFRQLDKLTCRNAVMKWLEENGFTFLASGREARVFTQNNSDFVVKVYYSAHWHDHANGSPAHKLPELQVQGPGIAKTIAHVTPYEILIAVQERVEPFVIDSWDFEAPEDLRIMICLVEEQYGLQDTIYKNFGKREDGEIVAIDWTVPKIAKETRRGHGCRNLWD